MLRALERNTPSPVRSAKRNRKEILLLVWLQTPFRNASMRWRKRWLQLRTIRTFVSSNMKGWASYSSAFSSCFSTKCRSNWRIRCWRSLMSWLSFWLYLLEEFKSSLNNRHKLVVLLSVCRSDEKMEDERSGEQDEMTMHGFVLWTSGCSKSGVRVSVESKKRNVSVSALP